MNNQNKSVKKRYGFYPTVFKPKYVKKGKPVDIFISLSCDLDDTIKINQRITMSYNVYQQVLRTTKIEQCLKGGVQPKGIPAKGLYDALLDYFKDKEIYVFDSLS